MRDKAHEFAQNIVKKKVDVSNATPFEKGLEHFDSKNDNHGSLQIVMLRS